MQIAEFLDRFQQQMADYEKEVGRRIKKARQQNRPDLTGHEAAAREFGTISAKQWGRWERGESLPRAANWNRLAEVLGVEVAELRGEPPAIAEDELRLYLERIEVKLDKILSRLPAMGPAEVLEEEAARVREQRERSAAAPQRKIPRRKAS